MMAARLPASALAVKERMDERKDGFNGHRVNVLVRNESQCLLHARVMSGRTRDGTTTHSEGMKRDME